jgi:hypothetical protein
MMLAMTNGNGAGSGDKLAEMALVLQDADPATRHESSGGLA